MRHDLELLKSSPDVIVGGIRTKVYGDFIARPYWNYMDDIYSFLGNKYPGEKFDDDAPWDHDPRFNYFQYDEVGCKFVVLSLDCMKEDEVDWDHDYVFVDTSNFPSYEQWKMDELRCMSDIDIPRPITDLSHDELIKLRSEVCVGSSYLSDFNNTLGVDRKEVCDTCEFYLETLEEDGDEDTPEAFANYVNDYIEC